MSLTAAAAALTGCASAPTQAKAVDAVLSDAAERDEAFEATLRVLDQHPEYVDELYVKTRDHHRKTMHRLLEDTTRDLETAMHADAVAVLLAQDPAALEQVMISTVDASKGVPAARLAIARAILRRSQQTAGIMTDLPPAVEATLIAAIAAIEKKPKSRDAMLAAMRQSADRLAEILKGDPQTTATLTDALVHSGAVNADLVKETAKRLAGERGK